MYGETTLDPLSSTSATGHFGQLTLAKKRRLNLSCTESENSCADVGDPHLMSSAQAQQIEQSNTSWDGPEP